MSTGMRIGLRVFSNPGWLGGVNYVLTWARALASLPAHERVSVCMLTSDAAGREIAVAGGGKAEAAPFEDASRLGLDFVFPATQLFEAPAGVPWAGWIPDWQCKHMPEMFDDHERARRDLHYRFMAERAPLVVVSSQMGFDDTVRIVGEGVVPLAKLHFPALVERTVYDATDDDLGETVRRLGVPDRFFLICNQFWKHKNHLTVIDALRRLDDPSTACVFTGETSDPRWPEYFQEVEAFVSSSGLGRSVFFLGRVARRDQLHLMRKAVAVIQPSRFEGWSSVVEECRALGRPLLLSTFPVHLEQAPPGVGFFDPEDAGQLARLMREVWDAPRGPGEPAAELLARQEAYVRDCAGRFLEIAQRARQAFDPVRHDLGVLLPALVRAAEQRRATAAEERLYHKVRRLAEGLANDTGPVPEPSGEPAWLHALRVRLARVMRFIRGQ